MYSIYELFWVSQNDESCSRQSTLLLAMTMLLLLMEPVPAVKAAMTESSWTKSLLSMMGVATDGVRSYEHQTACRKGDGDRQAKAMCNL